MKVPFFSKFKKAPSSVHLSSQSSSELSTSSSLSFASSSSSTSPPVSSREKVKERKRQQKLQKPGSLVKEKSGSWRSKSHQGISRNSSFDLSRELSEAFRYFDKNGDGKISATELGQVLGSLGIQSTHSELETMVREVDSDGDGFIDLEEFITLNRLALEATEGENGEVKTVQEAFDVFDINRDGFICASELYKVLSGLGEVGLTVEECHTMIKNVDQDGDGLVNFTEFKFMMHDNFVC